jgi:hypothetical protein
MSGTLPEVSTYGACAYVCQCIEEDRDTARWPEAFAMGSRSPYASLPSVDAFRRRKASGPETKTCATCRHLSGSQCDVHLEGHYQAWRGPCDYGRSWRPLRRALLVRLIGAVVGTISGRRQRKRPRSRRLRTEISATPRYEVGMVGALPTVSTYLNCLIRHETAIHTNRRTPTRRERRSAAPLGAGRYSGDVSRGSGGLALLLSGRELGEADEPQADLLTFLDRPACR